MNIKIQLILALVTVVVTPTLRAGDVVIPAKSPLQEAVPLQVAERRQRPAEELHPPRRGLARRLQEVLLRAHRLRPRRLWRRQLQEGAEKPP